MRQCDLYFWRLQKICGAAADFQGAPSPCVTVNLSIASPGARSSSSSVRPDRLLGWIGWSGSLAWRCRIATIVDNGSVNWSPICSIDLPSLRDVMIAATVSDEYSRLEVLELKAWLRLKLWWLKNVKLKLRSNFFVRSINRAIRWLHLTNYPICMGLRVVLGKTITSWISSF